MQQIIGCFVNGHPIASIDIPDNGDIRVRWIEPLVIVDRARFERLRAVACSAVYDGVVDGDECEVWAPFAAVRDALQPGDLDPPPE